MGTKDAPTKTGRESGEALLRQARKEEKKVEARKGSDLSKGGERVEERSRSSDGTGVASKQDD